MSEIVSVYFEVPGVADTEQYLDQPEAPFEWNGTWPVPLYEYHLISVTESTVMASAISGSPQVRGIPLLGGDDGTNFTVRWIFPGADSSTQVIGAFRAIFHKD